MAILVVVDVNAINATSFLNHFYVGKFNRFRIKFLPSWRKWNVLPTPSTIISKALFQPYALLKFTTKKNMKKNVNISF